MYGTVLYLLLSFVACVCCYLDSKRLLENDPSLILERLSKLEATVNQQQTTCNCTKDENIAFYATLAHQTTFGNAAVLKFDKVRTNIGNAYDPLAGMFVAPQTGTYTFTSIVYNEGASNAAVQLMRNQELLVRGFSNGAQHATEHTMNAVLRLQKGDHVYVQHRGGSTENVIGDDHSSFSGFMISA